MTTPEGPAATRCEVCAPDEHDDVSHYFRATMKLSKEVSALRARLVEVERENTRLQEEVERAKAERDAARHWAENAGNQVLLAEKENTPLRERVAALEKQLAEVTGLRVQPGVTVNAPGTRAVEYVDACPECGGPDDHVHLGPVPAVTGTTSDKAPIRKPAGGPTLQTTCEKCNGTGVLARAAGP